MNKQLSLKNFNSKCMLVILDGFGIREASLKNAIHAAKTPTFDSLQKNYPHTLIQGGGEFVGLPKGLAGNSEVGHLNLGSGRAVRQDLVRINEAIENKELTKRDEFQKLIKILDKKPRLHLMGLISDGGVHSHLDHLIHLIQELNKMNPQLEIFVHGFMDGRDTPKNEGINYLRKLFDTGLKFNLASIQGRSIGMDRDQRWEKIQNAYEMMTGEIGQTSAEVLTFMDECYQNELFDEFIPPTLFNQKGIIEKEDAIFFFNFRPDRAKQISLAYTDPNFDKFPRKFLSPYFLCMTPYIQEEMPQVPILFDKEKISLPLSQYLADQGKKQFKIAETEKYAHVTYFFNGGEETPFKNEDRILVHSPKDVATYDLKPEMSAYQVRDKLVEAIRLNEHDFYLVNFANADMVGHTGNFEAAVKAIEALDSCLRDLVDVCADQNIPFILTADHGNADQMVYEDGRVHTSHSGSPVPCLIIHPQLKNQTLELNTDITPALKDIAPTILNIMGLDKPSEFTGQSIFR